MLRWFPLNVALLLGVFCVSMKAAEVPRVILDTDMTFDVDDVGALAMLHAMQDAEEVQLLAVNFNEVHRDGAQAIHAINAWYGRSTMPIGIYRGELNDPDESRYLTYVANLDPSLESPQVQDAVSLYREILDGSDDRSVTIVSVGFLNNLGGLIEQHRDLVQEKVDRLVLMAGLKNDSFNTTRHGLVGTSQFVLEHWPTPLVIIDFGVEVGTGSSLKNTDAANPVREAYYRWFGQSFGDRASWDQIAVLYTVRGITAGFEEVVSGTGRLRNGFEWDLQPGKRIYARAIKQPEHYQREIERLMTIEPTRR